ncbi:MAG: hypothetical protein ACLQAT_05690 [Candidatus Binataceae bacterium]
MPGDDLSFTAARRRHGEAKYIAPPLGTLRLKLYKPTVPARSLRLSPDPGCMRRPLIRDSWREVIVAAI